ncbi:MAG TPA: GatB/YqeY domain-containing protein [Salinivirga sp.]|uniref:GatB/YqeY domain-containing protein n=1 Tax=Salinivirga sp. TaxID=1970192 RepID=UPI002B46CEE5|nr:GatB/YqeY domain-containing protein [Salinivirga sp.]HKK59240.1 GatB/YqeY domain-containing protein [Salinivirga sp.]
MSLEKDITQKMKEAMKAKNKPKLEAIRAIKNAILQEKTKAGGGDEIDEATEMKMLQKLVKQREDSAEIYKKEGRNELAEKELFEANIIKEFLPEQLSEDEIRTEIEKIITETGASSMKDMGKVMGMANKQMAGRADGKLISEIVKAKLQ